MSFGGKLELIFGGERVGAHQFLIPRRELVENKRPKFLIRRFLSLKSGMA